MLITPLIIGLALLLDYVFGEAKRYHPLVGFGNLANAVERRLNNNKQNRLINGTVALLLLCLPFSLLTALITSTVTSYYWIIDTLILYLAIGFKSLIQHSKAVESSMLKQNLDQAKARVAMMVSRDTEHLNSSEIATATVESTLENGSDSTYAVLFWYLVGSYFVAFFETFSFAVTGASLVILYRLSNTLDAMWGYRTERYEQFGKAAAKFDDLLNYVPARLTAFFYALAGNTSLAFQSWRKYAHQLASPNGGPVMSAGAGSINVKLGGPTYYHGKLHKKPYFGGANAASVDDITRANKLVSRALLYWFIFLTLTSLLLSYL